jgi:hypothetical protein
MHGTVENAAIHINRILKTIASSNRVAHVSACNSSIKEAVETRALGLSKLISDVDIIIGI